MRYATILLLFLVGCASGPSGNRTPIGGIGKGSTKSYYCRGERHHPQNYYEYDQTGLASWYGPGFHGKPKPYGELFNMHGISAAHRTLPLPTVVRVTNLQNGKYIKLVVDDRGPFVYEGRIIDLSAGAAKALGTYSKGLTTVRVQSVPDESRMLSNYLAKHGNTYGKMRDGRTWQQVYNDEIAGHRGEETVGGAPPQASIPQAVPSQQKTPQNSSKVDPIDELIPKQESIDDILNSVAPEKQPSNTVKSKIIQTNFNTYIALGETYVQKTNAQKIATSLPKEWHPSVQSTLHSSGQMLYNVKLGPIKNPESALKILKACQKNGFAQAIMIKD